MRKRRNEQEARLWERQPGESELAWKAFTTYLHLEKRTVHEVCELLSKTRQQITRWKTKWFWEERVRAYDNELEHEAFDAAIKERKEMNRRHINLAMHLQKAVVDALQSKDFSQMSDKDIVSFVRMATELERGARIDDLSLYPREVEEEENPQDEEVVIYVPDNGLKEEGDDEEHEE